MTDVTRILEALEQGDPCAAERLLPLVYQELRRLAAQRLVREDGKPLQWHRLPDEARPSSDEPLPLCDESSGLLGEGKWVPLPNPGPQGDAGDDDPLPLADDSACP